MIWRLSKQTAAGRFQPTCQCKRQDFRQCREKSPYLGTLGKSGSSEHIVMAPLSAAQKPLPSAVTTELTDKVQAKYKLPSPASARPIWTDTSTNGRRGFSVFTLHSVRINRRRGIFFSPFLSWLPHLMGVMALIKFFGSRRECGDMKFTLPHLWGRNYRSMAVDAREVML